MHIINFILRYAGVEKIFIHGKVYVLENRNLNLNKLSKFVNSVPENVMLSKVNEQLYSRLGNLINNAVKMASTEVDRDLILALFTVATSRRAMQKTLGKQNKTGLMNARD